MKKKHEKTAKNKGLWQGYLFIVAAIFCCLTAACGKTASSTTESARSASKCSADGCKESRCCQLQKEDEKKIAVLIISHGSHSKSWRNMVMGIEEAVRDKVTDAGQVSAIRSAFMEYTEPSIATRLKEFDEQGYSDIILVPLLLTVSSHSFDDIPTICGQKQDLKTTETLRLEGIDIYKPKAQVHIAPLLDFPSVLGKNVTRRVRGMSENPAEEGIVMVAYGSEPYNSEWEKLLKDVGKEVKNETNIDCAEHAWCGHVVRYKSEPTEKTIKKVLQQRKTALVVPVLVAVDEMFQGKIIGGAIKNVGEEGRIVYRHDAILPDDNINRWVVDISNDLASKIIDKTDTADQQNK